MEEVRDDVKGAGGKLSKRSFRSSRVSSTPYSRPPAVASAADKSKKSGGWFSKILVTPASKIFPSLFSSSSSKHQDQDQDENGDRSLPEIQQEHKPISRLTSNNQYFEPKESGASAKIMQPKVDLKNDDHVGYTSNNLGIAEIEQQLQQKKFSIDETNHLIELLRSRTIDLPDNDGHPARLKLEASEVLLGQKDVRKSMKEDYGVQFDSRMTQKSSEHFQFKANDVSSSPVEIAKAYMDSRTSASGYDCRSERLKIEKNSFYIDNSSSKLSFTPVVKSPICWPGAVVQSDHEYYTPRRVSIPHHPRTPYSATLFSKSTSKFQINSQRPDRSSTKQSSTEVFGHSMKDPRTNLVMDDGIASVSPIHRTHQKNFASIYEGAGRSSSERTLEDSSSKGGFYKFQLTDVMDEEVSRFAVDSTPVHPQSSLMARKILEHLDRSVPSPKDKLQEIKLARMRLPPKSNALVIDGLRDNADSSISDKQKTKCFVGGDVVSQEIADTQKVSSRQTSNDMDQPQPQTNKQGVFGLAPGTTAISAIFQTSENLTKSASFQTFAATKPSEKLRTPNNGFFSFTFPVPATSATFSEPPPTPTMASSLATGRTSEVGEGSIPLFNFGSKSNERIDFSLNSTVSISDIDVSTPSFKFGTENKSRLSFKLIGGDAICY